MALPMHSSDPAKRKASIRHVLAVAAGKGGVGKSCVTVNLALALTRAGHAVGILDTDLYGPSLRRMLPEDQLPARSGPSLLPARCQGISVISMAYFRPEQQANAVRAPIANRIIEQFLTQVDWGPLDYLLLDFPPGTGDIQLTLAQKASLSAALMITTPQQVAVMDVRKAMHLFDDVQVPILGIVENMSYYEDASGRSLELFGKGGGISLAQESGHLFLGQIPLDPRLSLYGDTGERKHIENTPISAVFDNLAKNVHSHLEALQARSVNSLREFNLTWRQM